MMAKLTDAFLIRHCNENLKHLTFLSEPAAEILRKLRATADGLKDKDEFLSREELGELWRELLVDAIHALKVRDRREKARLRRFPAKDPEKMRRARDQNVYGIGELTAYFKSFSDFERVLYGSESTYRDHITHVVRVWLIGVYLLTGPASIEDVCIDFPAWGRTPNRTSDQEQQAALQAALVTSPERWAMWTVVALCHDLGYPLEQTHQINDVIDNMLAHFGNIAVGRYRYSFQPHHQPLNEMTLRVIPSRIEQLRRARGKDELTASRSGDYRTVLQTKYYTKFAHSLEDFHHGIISCLVLMKTLIYFMETDYSAGEGGLTLEDARQFHIRREMLRAIASHTCPEVYHLRIDTLSFLLILCDQLQQWGRPTFREMKLGRAGSSDDGDVQVCECMLKDGRFKASVEYARGGPSPEEVRHKFRLYHKLLRAAIRDEDRRIHFEWQVTSRGSRHVFEYNSIRAPFEELAYMVNGVEATPELWMIETGGSGETVKETVTGRTQDASQDPSTQA